ncbi:hypothetical protein ES702_06730 [subsurface metagenome]
MTYQLKTLFDYSRKKGITDRKLASLLGVHYNSIWNWRHEKTEPSTIAKVIIRDFLIKSL